jgi:hypothetical protein
MIFLKYNTIEFFEQDRADKRDVSDGRFDENTAGFTMLFGPAPPSVPPGYSEFP